MYRRALTTALPCLLLAQASSFKEEVKRLSATGNWGKLQALAEARVASAPKDAEAHNALGMALANQGRQVESITAFNRAARADPRYTEAWFNLCLAGAKVGDRAATTEGLDGVADRNYDATRHLLGIESVQKVLGADLPATQTDFVKIKIRYQPPAPPYPPEAKVHRIQGMVKVDVVQDRDGRVILVQAVSGPKELLQTAEAYAACWRFFPIPGQQANGRLRFTLPMPFRLR